MIDKEANTRSRRDPVVEGVRDIRQRHAERFDYDPEAIFEDLRRYQREQNLEVVSLPARRLEELEDGAV